MISENTAVIITTLPSNHEDLKFYFYKVFLNLKLFKTFKNYLKLATMQSVRSSATILTRYLGGALAAKIL
jgi:hypothetical protein